MHNCRDYIINSLTFQYSEINNDFLINNQIRIVGFWGFGSNT